MNVYRFCPWDGEPFIGNNHYCNSCNFERLFGDPERRYRPPWKKVLYEKQPYEDNFVDESFLDSVVTNVNCFKRNFWSVVKDSLLVSQLVCVVVLLGTGTYQALGSGVDSSKNYLHEGESSSYKVETVLRWNDTVNVFWKGIVLSCLFCIIPLLGLKRSITYGPVFVNVYPLPKIAFMILFASGIIGNLARPISSDTIATSTTFLFLLYLFFFDYTHAPHLSPYRSSRISQLSALVACTLLSSRMTGLFTTFFFFIMCTMYLVVLPQVFFLVKNLSFGLHLLHTGLLSFTTLWFTWHINGTFAVSFIITIFCITFVCPYHLVKLQRYKYEISGPWDEAKLNLASQ